MSDFSTTGMFDSEHQIFFPTGETINQCKLAAFEKWRKANQHAITWLLENLDKLKRDRRGYCSTALLTAALRDHYRNKVKTDETYELNDHVIPYLKRHLVFLRRDLHLFEFRKPPVHITTCPNCGHTFGAAS